MTPTEAALRLRPITGWLCDRVTGGTPAIAAAAVGQEIVQPEETEPARRPLFLPGQLERVTATAFNTVAFEVDVARRETVRHAPVIRYVFEDCLIYPGGFSTRRHSFLNTGVRNIAPVAGRPVECGTVLYCLSPISFRFFGHWLSGSCTSALLAHGDEQAHLTPQPEWSHAPAYQRAFGLPQEPGPVIRCERLVYCHDFSQGSSRQARYRALRQRLGANLGLTDRPSRRVYLRRGKTGAARLVAGEADLAARLEASGFEIRDVAGADLETLAAALWDAEIVVTVEGSQMNHAHYMMRPGGLLVGLIPSDRFSLSNASRAQAFGNDYAFVVCDPSEAGYRVDPAELLDTLALWRGPVA